VFSVLSRGDDILDQRLRAFVSTQDCEFIAARRDSGGYHYHGEFVLPLPRAGTSSEEIDFAALRESLLNIARTCRAS
jgi:hypothetical protein